MAFSLNLEEWAEIPTHGSKNCGIFISDKYPGQIMKCEYGTPTPYNTHVTKLQEEGYNFFPHIFAIINKEEKKYIIMEKLDGDLTQYFSEYLPFKVIDEMSISESHKTEMKQLVPLKLVRNGSIPPTINEFTVDILMFDTFMSKLFERYDSVYEIIMKQLIGLFIRMFYKNIDYVDLKFDNFGYTMHSDGFIQIKCLDWGSGLHKIEANTAFISINHLIERINKGINLTVFHETGFFSHMWSKNNARESIKPAINTILSKSYIFDMSRFIHKFKTIDEIEAFIGIPAGLIHYYKELGYMVEDPKIVAQRNAGIPEINYIKHGQTKLMEAIYHNHLKRVENLLKEGANPHLVTTKQGDSAIKYAIQQKNADGVSLLLEHGVVLPHHVYSDEWGKIVPLFDYLIIRGSDLEFIKFMVSKGMKLPPAAKSYEEMIIKIKENEKYPEFYTDKDLHNIITVIIKNKKGGTRKHRGRSNRTRRVRHNKR